jgi:cytochrome c nitrite reductase small subunit
MTSPPPRPFPLRLVLGLILATCVGLFGGLGSYTFYYGEGHSYLSNDPAACVNCHIMRDQYDGWLKSSHHAVATCNDCHTPHNLVMKYISKAENGFWHSKGFTMQDHHEPIMIKPRNSAVLQQNCVTCHERLVASITPHAGERDKMLDCVSCHREVGHGARALPGGPLKLSPLPAAP